jgi:hypothetical protein
VLNQAGLARQAAAQELNALYQQVTNVNPHLNVGDAVTMGGLLADLLAAPTAARRGVAAKIKSRTGTDLKLRDEIADSRAAGRQAPKQVKDELFKVDKELQDAQARPRTR